MLNAKVQNNTILITVAAGDNRVHRFTSVEDAKEFAEDIQEAVEELEGGDGGAE